MPESVAWISGWSQDTPSWVLDAHGPRVVNKLLGEKELFYSPSQERGDTFTSSRGPQEFFPGRALMAWLKTEGAKTKKAVIGRARRMTKETFPGKAETMNLDKFLYFFISLFKFYAVHVSREESVLRTDILKSSCRWVLLMGGSAWFWRGVCGAPNVFAVGFLCY